MRKNNLGNLVNLPADTPLMLSSFRNELLMHLDMIRNSDGNTSIAVTQQEADKYFGDFHGLLIYKGQQQHHLWLLTIYNGLKCSLDYNSDFLDIKIPPSDVIDRLVDIYNTTHL